MAYTEEKEYKNGLCTWVTESLWCTPETNAILETNYIPIIFLNNKQTLLRKKGMRM